MTRYDLEKYWNFIRRDIPNFFKNIWRFRKVLLKHQWWDYHYTLEAMLTSFKLMEKGLSENGIEEKTSLNKKLDKIRRVIHILESIINDEWISLAEEELGKMPPSTIRFEPMKENPKLFEMVDDDTEDIVEFRRKIYIRADEIENTYWNELWDTLRGQDYKKFSRDIDWQDQFDGSGMRGWWD